MPSLVRFVKSHLYNLSRLRCLIQWLEVLLTEHKALPCFWSVKSWSHRNRGRSPRGMICKDTGPLIGQPLVPLERATSGKSYSADLCFTPSVMDCCQSLHAQGVQRDLTVMELATHALATPRMSAQNISVAEIVMMYELLNDDHADLAFGDSCSE